MGGSAGCLQRCAHPQIAAAQQFGSDFCIQAGNTMGMCSIALAVSSSSNAQLVQRVTVLASHLWSACASARHR